MCDKRKYHQSKVLPKNTNEKNKSRPTHRITSFDRHNSNKRKHGEIRKKCCFVNCPSTNKTTVLHRVQPPISKPNSSKVTLRSLVSYYRKVNLRKWTLSRYGLLPNDNRKDLRACALHELETTKQKQNAFFNNKKSLLIMR